MALNIDTARVKAAGGKIKEVGVSYKAEVNKIYQHVDKLKAIWSGTAASKYTNDIEQFRDDFAKIQNLIDECGNLVTSISKAYEELENELS